MNTTPGALTGPLAYTGWIVRRALKDHPCQCRNARGPGTGLCVNTIAAGTMYVEGALSPDVAGGRGRERYCAECIVCMEIARRTRFSRIERAAP